MPLEVRDAVLALELTGLPDAGGADIDVDHLRPRPGQRKRSTPPPALAQDRRRFQGLGHRAARRRSKGSASGIIRRPHPPIPTHAGPETAIEAAPGVSNAPRKPIRISSTLVTPDKRE
jgi:hypothetical protein